MKLIWGHTRRYNSYVDHMRRIYGSRIQKVAIDAGFSCPNRDGTKGTGGCTFCLNEAFNPSYCDPSKSIRQQLLEGIEFHRKRYRGAGGYLAYFQAYSNTYAPVDRLKELYHEALSVEGIVGLVVGTRPDCVDNEKLNLFKALTDDYYVMIEYGIESVYNKTLERINRGHSFEDAAMTIRMTAEKGIQVGGHMIFGLPGETRNDMLQSAEVISALPLNHIKFHQLQLFRGTAMELDYLQNPFDFHVFGMEEYIEFLSDYIERLNPAFIIERIAGETPPRYTRYASWGPRYDQILLKFEKVLEEKNSWQGKRFVKKSKAFV